MTGLRTYYDAFCGVGGFHVALAACGLECVGACDADPAARRVYSDNHGIEPTALIEDVDGAALPRIDVLCGGPPCQPFSAAGTRRGTADRRGRLWRHLVRLADEAGPAIVLIENVPGFADLAGTALAMEMRDAGYATARRDLDLADLGVPARRRRVYYICTRIDEEVRWRPPARVDRGRRRMLDWVRPWAGNPAVPGHWTIDLDDRPVPLCAEDMPPGRVVRVGRKRLADGADDPPGSSAGMGRVVYDASGYAPCFTSGVSPRRKFGIYRGPGGSCRMLSIRSALRLMTFPARFRLPDTHEGFRLLGNAVAPRQAAAALASVSLG